MKTKWIALAIFSGIIIFGSSCKKIKDLLTFDMKYSTSTFPIPAISQEAADNADTTITVSTPSVPTNSESTFKGKNTASKLIKEITLSSFELQITDPSTATYNYIDNIEVYINSSGNAEELIASKNVGGTVLTGTTLALETTGANLMNHIKADNFSLKVKLKVDGASVETTNKANMVFQVKADPL